VLTVLQSLVSASHFGHEDSIIIPKNLAETLQV